ncbi:MAG: hypothetical protein LDL13_05245 [Calditerrivibrio sp.]|nr:hypothetical protein [Calditerrivibrio sp.]MCA1932964.1 hypothetical protein [Calditerrivibrio sp.]
MILYIIFAFVLVFFSYLGFSINTILMFIAVIYALISGFTLDSSIFVFSEKFYEIIFMPEIVAIPFFVLSSELLINSGITKKFKCTIFYIFGNTIFGFILYSISIMTTATTSMIFNSSFETDFSTDEFKDEKVCINTQFLLSSVNYVAPISVPIIIMASLLKVSLKTVVFYSILLSLFILIAYYLIFLKGKLRVKNSGIFLFPLVVIVGYMLIFYSLMFLMSYPIDIIAIILFFYVIVIVLIFDFNRFKEILYLSLDRSLMRSGIIMGVVYFISMLAFFHIYTFSNSEIINYLTLSFSEGYYILIIMYVIAFFMSEIIDPLGIILILFPIYDTLIQSYNIDRYIFILSFSLFLSMGLFNNISELMGERIRGKFNIPSSAVYETIYQVYIFICFISFGIYFL